MKKILGKSDTWFTSCLSHWLSKPAYHIVDCGISNSYAVISTINKMEPSAQETNFETIFRKCPPQNKWKGIIEKRRKSLTAEGSKIF